MKPLLDDITIEITNHCQLHCQHCGIWAEPERHEMTAAMIVRSISELLGKYQIKFVSITGGEPFLNRNCGRLLKALSILRERRDINGFGVYSNAAYFEGVRRVLTNYMPYVRGMHMGISVDGNPQTHDVLRGQGFYQKTFKTIDWIVENFKKHIILEFKFTINSVNYADLYDVYQLARRYDVRFSPKIMESSVKDYYHRHQMPNTDALAALSKDQIKQVKSQINQMLKDDYHGVDRQMVEASMVLLEGGRQCIRACETPARSLFITSRREVFPCLYMSSAGFLSNQGALPAALDEVRSMHAQNAAQGQCPGCFAYHGFLKKFNLAYLQVPNVQSSQHR